MAFHGGDVMTVPPANPRFHFNAPSMHMDRPRIPLPGGGGGNQQNHNFGGGQSFDPSQPGSSGNRADFQPFYLRPAYRFKPQVMMDGVDGPGRRLRKNLSNVRRHVDYVSNVLMQVESRFWQRNERDRPATQPDLLYATEIFPPGGLKEKPIDCVCTKFVRSAQNKVKCPIYDICWTPEGRRLITGASTGEFTLWNGTAFNFETILQAHDTAIRALEWSHNAHWLISADQDGFVKYWQANMNNVHMYQAHKEAVRCVSFSPSDSKMATASDDGTVRVWDFLRCSEERILRGHGSDVRSVDWHPTKGLLVSGSRDTQQPVKIWDPKSGQCLATLHDHKNSVMAVQWNGNGNWMISGSRDHLIKLYDIRMMREVRSFRGHKKEVTSLGWHPVHEGMFVSGGGDGSMAYWLVTNEKEVGLVEHAHDQAIWTLKWHPLGHTLASGSNDNNTKFWARNKPGDSLEDFHNMAGGGQMANMGQVGQVTQTASQRAATGTITQSQEDKRAQVELEAQGEKMEGPATGAVIPGMGLEEGIIEQMMGQGRPYIPGLMGPALLPEDPNVVSHVGAKKTLIKQPPPKKAQRQFERMWNVSKPMGSGGAEDEEEGDEDQNKPQERPRKSLLGLPPPEMAITDQDTDHGPPQHQRMEQHMHMNEPHRMPPPRMGMGGPRWRPRGGFGMRPPGGPGPRFGGSGPRSSGPGFGGPGPRHPGPAQFGGIGSNHGGAGFGGSNPEDSVIGSHGAGSSMPSFSEASSSGLPAQQMSPPSQQPQPPVMTQQALMASAQQQAAAAILQQRLGPMFQINQQQQHQQSQLQQPQGSGRISPTGTGASRLDRLPPIPPPHAEYSRVESSVASGGDVDFRRMGPQNFGAPQQFGLPSAQQRAGPATSASGDQDFRARSGAWPMADEDMRQPQQQTSRDPRQQRQQQPLAAAAPELRDPRKRALPQQNSENGGPNDDRNHVNPKRKWQQEYEAEEQVYPGAPRGGMRGRGRGQRGRGRGRGGRR